MADIFDEISEDLRRENLARFWKENGSWIIGGAIGAIVLTAFMSFMRQRAFTQNTRATTELALTVDATNYQKLEQFAATADKDHAMIARFIAADNYIDNNQKDKAVALYAQISGTSGIAKVWRDLARIHSISLRLDTAPAAQLAAELAPLAASDCVWRYTAREMQALLAARQGDMQKAADLMAAIAADPGAPDDERQRAFSLHALYIADAKANRKS
ncbi:MAG: hypothetical protein KGQ70_00160 [Alphaproteobacteria bacterium]|nr:hypothetical protein [Alphaproteobacteria bacterium]